MVCQPVHNVSVPDLSAAVDAELLGGFKDHGCFHEPQLNAFMGMGKPAWRLVRNEVQKLLLSTNGTLRDDESARSKVDEMFGF